MAATIRTDSKIRLLVVVVIVLFESFPQLFLKLGGERGLVNLALVGAQCGQNRTRIARVPDEEESGLIGLQSRLHIFHKLLVNPGVEHLANERPGAGANRDPGQGEGEREKRS